MSNLMHKVKDAVTHDKSSHAPSTSSNAYHNSNIANTADPRVDNSRVPDNRQTFTTGTGVGGTAGASSTAPHPGTTIGTASEYNNPRSANAGPHGSNVANVVDPRVDSHRGQYGTSGATSGGYSHSQSTHTGAHSSNLANAVDPRTTNKNHHRETAGGIPSGYDNPRSTNAGPHGLNVANAVDPRVDSDHSKIATTGGLASNGYANNHNIAHPQQTLPGKAESRGTSEFDNRNLGSGVAPAGSSYTTPGSGKAQNTAGPHNSDMMNKLDPRVDSDLDNSRTLGNATRS